MALNLHDPGTTVADEGVPNIDERIAFVVRQIEPKAWLATLVGDGHPRAGRGRNQFEALGACIDAMRQAEIEELRRQAAEAQQALDLLGGGAVPRAKRGRPRKARGSDGGAAPPAPAEPVPLAPDGGNGAAAAEPVADDVQDAATAGEPLPFSPPRDPAIGEDVSLRRPGPPA